MHPLISNNNTPYENLNPNIILAAIESVGYNCNGSLLALNSYENRVYQIGIEDSEPVIAKFYRPNRWSNAAIKEEHEFSRALCEREIPIVEPLSDKNGQTLHEYQGYRFAIFPRRSGRSLEPDNYDQLELMGRLIARIHALGSLKPFLHRTTLDIESYGLNSLKFLVDNDVVPVELRSSYIEICEQVLAEIEAAYLSVPNLKYIRIHGDCHLGNLLCKDDKIHIVDLDDATMGPAVQDIWMLVSGNIWNQKMELSLIIDAYREFHDFDLRELNLIEPLRTLRMIQYSAWLASRWNDPAFPKAFPWFDTRNYWQEQITNLKTQYNILLEKPNYLLY